MKRSLQSEPHLPLKRRSSSLFSISTLLDDEKREDEELLLSPRTFESRQSKSTTNGKTAIGILKHSQSALACHAPSSQSTDPPTSEDEESCHDDGGFFIEGDLTPTSSPLLSRKEMIIDEISEIPASEIIHDINDIDENDDRGAESVVEGIKVATRGTHLVGGRCRTGIVHEDGARHFDHRNRYHKERPIRVTSIMEALASNGVLPKCCSTYSQADDEVSTSATDFLNDEDYLRVHLPGYMQRLDKLSICACQEKLDREACQFNSIFFTKDTVEEAKKAAAALCGLVDRVVTGQLNNGFAVIRPPGHHAEPGLAGGYCVINNVAVAAAYAKAKLGMNRILIVDWDVHHGNGTQSIFLDDPDVLYFSVHRWEGGNFFPFLQNGGPTNIGIGGGTGFNINVAWSKKGMGDDEYYAAWEHVLLPVTRDFQPELVLISAGFDAAEGDLGENLVSPECFGELTRSLKKAVPHGRIVATLEGGYVRSVLAKCVSSVVEALLNDENDRGSEEPQCPQVEACEDRDDGYAFPLDSIDRFAAKNIQSTITAHKLYWKCFQDDRE